MRRSFSRGARSLKEEAAAAVIDDVKESNAGSVLDDSTIASSCRELI